MVARSDFACRVVVIFIHLRWQIIASLCLAAISCSWFLLLGSSQDVARLADFGSFIMLMGVIASVLALSGSISFGYLLRFMDSAASRKENLYGQFRAELIRLEDCLNNVPQEYGVVAASQSVLLNLKALTLKDLPITNWDERMQPIIDEMESDDDREDHRKLAQEMLVNLVHLEELLGQIGVESIRQQLTVLFLRPVVKIFFLLAVVLLFMTIGYVTFSRLSPLVILGCTVFFGLMSAFPFVEIGWYAYREFWVVSFNH